MGDIGVGTLDTGILPADGAVRASRDASAAIELPAIPRADVLWRSLRAWIWAGCALALFRAVPIIAVDYWFLDSLGRGGVFRTNFTAQLVLFCAALLTFAPAVALSVRANAASPALRRGAVDAGLWIGGVAGWLLARQYLEFLLAYHGGTFGEIDPVFGRDVGFYVFTLPAISTALTAMTALAALGAAATVIGRYDQLRNATRHQHGASSRQIGRLLVTRG
ncbi:MAG TPA: UPF0182 family protein, partial [Vicinamibacterales bacterium]|nr:UPF0182 family protein [Vicinamibacterales bacterium]